MSAYGAFSKQGCLHTFQREVCRPGAAAVTAGRATFNADAVDARLEAHAAAHAICTPVWQETLDMVGSTSFHGPLSPCHLRGREWNHAATEAASGPAVTSAHRPDQ
jgi:hypothetical protein